MFSVLVKQRVTLTAQQEERQRQLDEANVSKIKEIHQHYTKQITEMSKLLDQETERKFD